MRKPLTVGEQGKHKYRVDVAAISINGVVLFILMYFVDPLLSHLGMGYILGCLLLMSIFALQVWRFINHVDRAKILAARFAEMGHGPYKYPYFYGIKMRQLPLLHQALSDYPTTSLIHIPLISIQDEN